MLNHPYFIYQHTTFSLSHTAKGGSDDLPEENKRERFCQRELSIDGQGKIMNVELVKEEEEAPKEETKVEDNEEMLEDGTVHFTHRVRTSSFKSIKKTWKSIDGEEIVEEEKAEVPGSVKEQILETFDEPPKLVREEENVDQLMDDGTVVHKKLVHSRMVHKFRTRTESFDSDSGRQVEDFVIDEVVPGTESAYLEGSDATESDFSEDEEEPVEEVKSDHTQDMHTTSSISPDRKGNY